METINAATTYQEYRRIRYRIRGNGLPVLWIPGLGLNAGVFDPLLDLVQATFRCLQIDFSGDVPARERRNCSIDRIAEEVHQFLGHIQFRPAAIVGHSLGGFIAQKMMLHSASPHIHLILLSSAAHGDPSLFRRFLPEDAMTMDDLLQRNMAMCVNETFSTTPEFHTAVRQQLAHSGSGKCFVPLLRGATTFNVLDALQMLRNQTLILHGEDDPIAPLENGKRLHREISRSIFISFPSVAHLPQLEAPKETAEAILNFLVPKN